jgi:hypothetical protein
MFGHLESFREKPRLCSLRKRLRSTGAKACGFLLWDSSTSFAVSDAFVNRSEGFLILIIDDRGRILEVEFLHLSYDYITSIVYPRSGATSAISACDLEILLAPTENCAFRSGSYRLR